MCHYPEYNYLYWNLARILGLILLALQKLAWDFLMTTCGQCHMFLAHLRDGTSHTATASWNHFRVGKKKLGGQTGRTVASSETDDIFDVGQERAPWQTPALRGQELLLTQALHVPSLSFTNPYALRTLPDKKCHCPIWDDVFYVKLNF